MDLIPDSRQRWRGSPPITCELCHRTLVEEFVDGKTIYGPWAKMCTSCHETKGVGLGLGRGQRYELPTLVKLEG